MNLGRVSPSVVRAALPLATIFGSMIAAFAFGIEIALLIVASGALIGVVALLWASVQSLTGEAPITLEEALGLGAPSAEEEQKRAVLRALKDLEFERSVGKISEDDYADLSARYRAEAKRLMQALDESAEPERARVDKLVAERLVSSAKRNKKSASGGEPSAAAPDDAPDSKKEDDDAPESADPSGSESDRAPPSAGDSASADEEEAPKSPAARREAGGESS
jgi:hypothetical protein